MLDMQSCGNRYNPFDNFISVLIDANTSPLGVQVKLKSGLAGSYFEEKEPESLIKFLNSSFEKAHKQIQILEELID